jgi:hypothetical protein
MARAKKNGFRRYLPVLLLAAALAESAHAPLVSGAMDATKNTASNNPATADSHAHRDPDKKAPITWTAPPIADAPDPSTIKKKLKEMESEKRYDPWQPTVLSPPGLSPDPQVTSPIDLVSTTATPADGAIGGAGGFDPSYPVPATAITSDGGDGGGFLLPLNPIDPPNPHQSPIVHDAPPITPVPEPGTLSVLVCGMGLLCRRARTRFQNRGVAVDPRPSGLGY